MGDTTTTTTTTTKQYQHTSAQEYIAWRLKVKSKARKEGTEIHQALMDITKVKAGANREVANSKLFDIMVDMIGSDALLNTLAIRYPDQGH